MQYWLMKSEPDVFSITDLKNRPDKTEPWDGIRNYQARNFIRDEMKPGDLAFFYHSNCSPPGIVGIMQIKGKPRPDPAALDKNSKYYDPRSGPDNPRWFLVDVKYKRQLKRIISLDEMRQHKALKDMKLLQKGNRLSIMPVRKKEWDYILDLE
ncbi:MAG: EVE domain-containing protein [Gammaproteobacteria bacterium]